MSNNARVETIRQNSDAIDGVKFVGTLDGKTCPYCASYDGYIWRGEEMSQARRPPIHPNCRCTLVPYVQLKDESGNPIDLGDERPAANADFDKLAKDAYNAKAREREWSRRWDDLKYETRLKYYYQTQKDFEARTGKKAYDRVPASLSFADYFRRQPASFKKSWLGAKRYAAYAAAEARGEDKEELLKIFQPSLGYMQTIKSMRGWAKGYDATIEEEKRLEGQNPNPQPQPVVKNPEYRTYKPTFDTIETDGFETWKKKLESKSNEKLEELLEAADKAEIDQENELDNREPNANDYDDDEKFQEACEKYADNEDKISAYFGKVKDAILGALRKCRPQEESETPENHEQYLDSLKKRREARLSESEAKEEEKKAKAWAADNRNQQTARARVLAIKDEIAKAEKDRVSKKTDWEIAKSSWGDYDQRTKQFKAELDAINARIATLEAEYDQTDSEMQRLMESIRKGRGLREDRRKHSVDKSIKRSLDVLFPNNGGKTFFSKEFRKQVIAIGKKLKCKQEAKEVLDLYDRIARCYNTGGRTITEPTEIRLLRSDALGGFLGTFGEITISTEHNSSDDFYHGRIAFRRTLAHELGHWLELWALGEENAKANAEWLASEQGATIKKSWGNRNDHEIPCQKQPSLCHDYWFYSHTIRMPIKAGIQHLPLRSEVFSTAMELICADPETMARQSPKHFDLVMRNLAQLSDGTKSFDPATYRKLK